MIRQAGVKGVYTMITTAFFTAKGGVGKSSLTVNLSAALYRYHKKRVLVMDCDAQNNASGYLMGIGQERGSIPGSPHTVSDYLRGRCQVSELAYNVTLKDGRRFVTTGIDVIASGTDIDDIEPDSIDVYKDILKEVSDNGSGYDYCFIDCPPQKIASGLAAINAADCLLIPVETENDSSFSGYTMAVDLVNDFRDSRINETLKILGIVISKSKTGRSSLDKFMVQQCRDQFGTAVFDTMIREAQVINDAYMFRDPVVYYKKSSPAASDYRKLSDEFIKRSDAMMKGGL